jgi:hypothetical protein
MARASGTVKRGQSDAGKDEGMRDKWATGRQTPKYSTASLCFVPAKSLNAGAALRIWTMGRQSIIAAGVVLGVACGLLLQSGGAAAANCTREDFANAVDRAGAALRKINAENAPRLQTKLRQLKTKMGWADAGYEEKAFQLLQDDRIAALDAEANDRLARIDALGTISPSSEPDCAKLDELSAANLELQATVKTKTAYILSKIDQMLDGSPIAAQPPAQPKAKVSEAKPAETKVPPPAPPQKTAKTEPPIKAERPVKAPAEPPRDMVVVAPPDKATPQPPGPLLPPEEEGYTIDEIKAASAGFFGTVSTSLGAVIEHVFSQSGRPTGYVLGTEGGGALLAGVRYGSGTLYMRTGGQHRVYWHGPSLGADIGGAGSKTLFLIYKLREPEQLYTSFTGIDGSAYLVGGVGATFVTNGSVIMAPIRSGLGLRLGANVGYIRFTPRATWNPF